MPGGFDLEKIAIEICNHIHLNYIKGVGKGAFKQTFHVNDGYGISFALKVYRHDAGIDRIIREIRAMEKCSHSSIAKIISVDTISIQQNTYLYVIEEFLAGGTLQDKLNAGTQFSRSTILTFGNQLLEAIAHIASLNLVHRDIKPANILFRNSGFEPVITDFGIVRDLNAESLTASWALRAPGTPYYAAPEQMNNEKHLTDWRTDQFSCGILLSVIALNMHPYDYGGEITLEAIAERWDTTKTFQEAIRKNNYPVLSKMVEGWPVKRYRTVAKLIQDWNRQGE